MAGFVFFPLIRFPVSPFLDERLLGATALFLLSEFVHPAYILPQDLPLGVLW